jgi:hypothetical protein
MVPFGMWDLVWIVAGVTGGLLGRDVASWHGWGLVALVMVGTLSLSAMVRWWRLGRGDGSYRPRSLPAMVVSFGVLGGLLLSVVGWPVAVAFGTVLSRVPGLDDHVVLRCLAGAGAVAPLFVAARWLPRRQAVPGRGQAGSADCRPREVSQAEQSAAADGGGM